MTIVAIRIMPALIPMQSARSRATFRSRDPTFVGRRARLVTFKVQPPFEPRRHRSRPVARSKRVRPYERTLLPAWQPEPTKWCHGSPAGHACGLQARGLPPSSPDGRRWPNPTFGPLMATFLSSQPRAQHGQSRSVTSVTPATPHTLRKQACRARHSRSATSVTPATPHTLRKQACRARRSRASTASRVRDVRITDPPTPLN